MTRNFWLLIHRWGDLVIVSALSGGQKQRLFLARALYKKPRLLFLDEATSHVDVGMENQVNVSPKQLGLTKIMVAHRPEAIHSADRIIELESRGVVRDFCAQQERAR